MKFKQPTVCKLIKSYAHCCITFGTAVIFDYFFNLVYFNFFIYLAFIFFILAFRAAEQESRINKGNWNYFSCSVFYTKCVYLISTMGLFNSLHLICSCLTRHDSDLHIQTQTIQRKAAPISASQTSIMTSNIECVPCLYESQRNERWHSTAVMAYLCVYQINDLFCLSPLIQHTDEWKYS